MLRKLMLVAALLATSAYATDNFNVIQAGGQTRTKAAKDIGGDVLADKNVIVDGTGNEVLGAVTASPAANTIGDRLKSLNTTLGSPFQAGGSIGNTSFGASQSGTWNITNVSGTVSLPTGAATSANQTTGNSSLSSIDTKLSSQATAANQTTANSSLSTIATQTNLAKSTTNVLDSPRAGTSNRVITRVPLTEDTSMTICPAQAAVISTKIQFMTAGVGVSDDGVSLTSGVPGTGSTTPNWIVSTAGVMVTYDVPPTNAITARADEAAGAGLVVCTQTLRQ